MARQNTIVPCDLDLITYNRAEAALYINILYREFSNVLLSLLALLYWFSICQLISITYIFQFKTKLPQPSDKVREGVAPTDASPGNGSEIRQGLERVSKEKGETFVTAMLAPGFPHNIS